MSRGSLPHVNPRKPGRSLPLSETHPGAFTKGVYIVGAGLIGTSLARAVRRCYPSLPLYGTDADPNVRRRCAELSLFDGVDRELGASATRCDLVVLAVPVGSAVAVMEGLKGRLAPRTVLTDVGSTKADMAKVMTMQADDGVEVIPCHPIAGTEHSGPDAGFAELFRSRYVVLTPTERSTAEGVRRMEAFWRALGARTHTMDPVEHDGVLAVTSHVPHLLSFAYVDCARQIVGAMGAQASSENGDELLARFSAGGFRDFTRIAASDPVMWRDVFLSNRDDILAVLEKVRESLDRFASAIKTEDGAYLSERIHEVRQFRSLVLAWNQAGRLIYGEEDNGNSAPGNDGS